MSQTWGYLFNLKSWEVKSEIGLKGGRCPYLSEEQGYYIFRNYESTWNSLSNYHRWLWNLNDPVKEKIKFQRRLACRNRYLPETPISRMLLSNPGGESLVVSTPKVLLGISC